MLEPKDIANAMTALRADSLRLLSDLDDAQLTTSALPGWTVADVFRHLADSDRRSVRGKHLLEFLPGKDLEGDFQEQNDRNLARLRAKGHNELRSELEIWGRRMSAIVRHVPGVVAAIRIPTGFGRVPIGWLAGLRVYDEWVHQWDVRMALDLDVPPMSALVAEVLATWHLLAFEADAFLKVEGEGVVEVRFLDAPDVRQFDLGARTCAVTLGPPPEATATLDVGSWCLLAAERVDLDALLSDGRCKIDGLSYGAKTLLDAVRVV